MNIVEVKHAPSQKKTYWFEVPDDLIEIIRPGDTVLCDTVLGRQKGIAQTVVVSSDTIENIAVMHGATLPLKRVVGVYKTFPMDVIEIPEYMKNTKPAVDKLVSRIEEWYLRGVFKTKVVISNNGTLQDGYTAYLVAKMFGLKNIPVYIESSEIA